MASRLWEMTSSGVEENVTIRCLGDLAIMVEVCSSGAELTSPWFKHVIIGDSDDIKNNA